MNYEITPEASLKVLPGTFPGDLGIELVAIDDEHVEGRMLVDRRHLHPGGYVHGGVWVAFADTVAAWGTLRNLAPSQNFTTVELKANVFVAAGVGDVVQRAAGTEPDRLALIEARRDGTRQEWTFGEAAQRSGALAATLVEHGV